MTKPSKQQADSGAPEISAKLPLDFFVPTLATAIVDDDDPADERSGENQAAVRQKNGNTAAAEEFQYSDEDRDGADE
jgi:hypothetical protein